MALSSLPGTLANTVGVALVAAYVTCTNLRPSRNVHDTAAVLPGLEAPLGLEEPGAEGALVLTLRAIWEHYHHHLSMVDAERTVKSYRWVLWAWFAFLGTRRWQRATKRDLQRFVSRPPMVGRRAKGQTLAPNTQLSYASTVCKFYRWAFENDYIKRNPMAGFVLPKGGQPVPQAFAADELRQIMLTAEHDPRLYVMCWLAYGQGCRCAEIAAARIEDIAFGEPLPRITIHGKGGRDRTLPLHPRVHAAVVRELAARGNPRVGPLVESRTQPGRGMTPGSVSRALSDHIRGLGVDGSGHGLRHSAATAILAAGKGRNLEDVRAFLGHKDSRVTRIYIASYPWHLEEAVAAIPDPVCQADVRE